MYESLLRGSLENPISLKFIFYYHQLGNAIDMLTNIRLESNDK